MISGAEQRLLLDHDIPLHPIPASAASFRIALLPACVSLLIYLLCLPASLPGGMAGDLVAAVVVPEVTSGGSSLWRWPAALLTELLPFQTTVWKLSFFSALATAVSVAVFTVWLLQQDVARRAAIAAGLFLAFGNAIWSSATVPSVLPLFLLLTTITLVLFYQWLSTREDRWLFLAALATGLGSFQHPFFSVPGALLMVGAVMRLARTRAQLHSWVALPVGLLLGLLPFAWAGSGWVGASGSVLVHRPDSFLLQRIAVDLGFEHYWIGVPFFFATLVIAMRRARRPLLPLFVLLIAPIITAAAFFDRVPAVAADGTPLQLAAPALIALAAFIGRALDLLLRRTRMLQPIQVNLVGALTACLPLVLLIGHFHSHDLSRYKYVEEMATQLVSQLPEDALLVTTLDYRGAAVRHALLVEAQRPDVTLLDRQYPDTWPSDRPIFATAPTPQRKLRTWTPVGLAYLSIAADEPTPTRHASAARFTDLPADPLDYRPKTGAPLDATARHIASRYYAERVRDLVNAGRREDADRVEAAARTLTESP